MEPHPPFEPDMEPRWFIEPVLERETVIDTEDELEWETDPPGVEE